MPFFGNNIPSLGAAGINDDMYGHFDIAWLPSWGLPIPACVVTRVWVYANGSAAAETSVLRFGIYDATAGPPYTAWPLVATTPTVSIASGAPVQWWSVMVSIALAAGSYALAVLDINGPAMTWSAGLRCTLKAVGMCVKTFVGGVFPNPLGICVTTTQNPCLYADYVPVGERAHAPTAACYSQPKCGEG